MDAAAALALIAKAATEGRVGFTEHAETESMPDDGVFRADVLHVLANGDDAVVQNEAGTKWKIYGPILDGSAYAVVVVVIQEADVVVVTTHPPP